VGDVTKLPVPNEEYDVYISFETFEHVEDEQLLLEHATRVLKPDGIFACSTPNRSVVSPGHGLSDRPLNPFHTREYDQGEFDSILRHHFSDLLFYGQTFFPAKYTALLNRIGRKAPALAVRLHQIRKILGVVRENEGKHQPMELPLHGEPEVLIAVCRNRAK
jgi:ubiquinone/menaquinone biosynthesis C-methylase UbiE